MAELERHIERGSRLSVTPKGGGGGGGSLGETRSIKEIH